MWRRSLYGGLGVAPGGTSLAFGGTIDEAASNDDPVGTLSVSGAYSGTPSFGITDASGTFQVDSETGEVTVLDNSALGTEPYFDVTFSVSGVTPAPENLDYRIYVVASAPTIAMLASSDHGTSSSDNITNETQPVFDFT